jgi:hypothetical protein
MDFTSDGYGISWDIDWWTPWKGTRIMYNLDEFGYDLIATSGRK